MGELLENFQAKNFKKEGSKIDEAKGSKKSESSKNQSSFVEELFEVIFSLGFVLGSLHYCCTKEDR